MKDEKIKNYILQAEAFLKKGDEALNKGDLRRPGEKYWGAATQLVKSYAEFRQWPHDGHALLFKDVARIAEEYKDEEIRGFFHQAHILHVNFYEGWLSKEDIENDASAVKMFIDKIKAILNNEKDIFSANYI